MVGFWMSDDGEWMIGLMDWRIDGARVSNQEDDCELFLIRVVERMIDGMVRYAAINLDGKAMKWHAAFVKQLTKPITNVAWFEYSSSIVESFSTNQFNDPMGILTSTIQSGELEEFCERFDENLLRVNICEEYVVSIFLNGLKPDLAGLVRMFEPKTMKEAYKCSKKQDMANKNLSRTKSYSNHSSKFYPSPTPVSANKPNTIPFSTYKPNTTHSSNMKPPVNTNHLPLLPTPPTNQRLTNNNKNRLNLPNKEMEAKRLRGECFWCPEKFSSTHKCPNKQLYVLEIEDEDEGVDAECQDAVDTMIDTTTNDPLISIHALTGVPSFSTMQVVGNIGTKTLHILTDLGSTHNFLDEKLAHKLDCKVEEIGPMRVGVANGLPLLCTKICKNFEWQMQGLWFNADVLVIPLASYDMVLGIQWLLPLGDIIWNFKELTMQFKVGNKSYILKGSQNNKLSFCSLEVMHELLTSERQVVQGHIYSLKVDEQKDQFQHKTVISNNEFDDVFEIPKSLPPHRAYDHRIVLKDENVTISQKPYRYQVAQKDIIENMTKELLDSGVIRGSTSPFAAPVVLVKKKDGSWRMCIDYRKLNDATVKNGFPIPLIEDLLDELGEATVFSKLDHRSGYHQIRMCPDDVHKTTFKTHERHFEFLVMPFGLTNAPTTFQALMNHTCKPLLRKSVLVFFDDILVYSKNLK
ncbi:uncharacterized protein LOC110866725 [Helianthus annuus]|uniref:uncharacterized protein LOC110866725 n=1 Tax=Helianthus annuus TaxID=4232 RepID=UPI000B8FE87A|nr:uncharacterized protein LOC110866725 [Helianthus annuus]